MSKRPSHITSKKELKNTTISTDSNIDTSVNHNVDTVAKRLFYAHDPSRFTKELSDCMLHPTCFILYWHVQKTGGTFLASRFYPKLNLQPYNSKEWCCNDQFINNRFLPNITDYCQKQIGIYEVKPHQYQQVIQSCTNLYKKKAQPPRYMGLVTIREPLQRTQSGIHQYCNVHTSRLDEVKKRICKSCQYDQDDKDSMEFYGKIVNDTNNIYTELRGMLHENSSVDIPLFVVDNTHLAELMDSIEHIFTHKLVEVGLLQSNETFHFPNGKSNAEKEKKVCDFGMHSSMMKQHAASLKAYHWMWAGIV